MLNLHVTTKLPSHEIIKKAVDFFGPGGYGLKVIEQSDACAYFEGGGGGIEITACSDDKGTSVDLETR